MEQERLQPEELGYHRQLQRDVAAITGAWQHWSGWLARRYRLGPSDVIHEDGTVERGVREVPADQPEEASSASA